jgi:putative Ca2+/H+ antiporter (TMEM165/GDT1 family)
MQAFVSSAALVAVAELGDKTQLLSFVLAARFRRPFPIIGGIVAATLLNHALAGSVGVWLADMVPRAALNWLVSLACIGFGVWALRPDALDHHPAAHRAGAFVTAFVTFFVAEMGDKTQLATVFLAARFDALWEVVLGTTFGILIADAPAVFMGEALAQRIPMKAMRWSAAALFFGMGMLPLLWPAATAPVS